MAEGASPLAGKSFGPTALYGERDRFLDKPD